MPKWLTKLEEDFAPIRSRLMALNVHDAVLQLVEGGCDLLLCYHHPRQPVQLDPGPLRHAGAGPRIAARLRALR
jgi:hypothetical protein